MTPARGAEKNLKGVDMKHAFKPPREKRPSSRTARPRPEKVRKAIGEPVRARANARGSIAAMRTIGRAGCSPR